MKKQCMSLDKTNYYHNSRGIGSTDLFSKLQVLQHFIPTEEKCISNPSVFQVTRWFFLEYKKSVQDFVGFSSVRIIEMPNRRSSWLYLL
jgi:hypothetical protein